MHASTPVPRDFAMKQSNMVEHCLSWHTNGLQVHPVPATITFYLLSPVHIELDPAICMHSLCCRITHEQCTCSLHALDTL